MTYYLISGGLGMLSGLILFFLAIHHLKVRSEFDEKNIHKKIQNVKFAIVWMLVTMMMFLVVAYCERGKIDGSLYTYWQLIRITIFAMLAIDVSAIDILIRRIPNAVLLGMLLLEAINIGFESWLGQDVIMLVAKALIGAIVAYVIFTLPSIFHLNIGAGDIKYSVVIGFVLSYRNFFEAMAVMAVANLLFYIYLRVFGKGHLKTAAPMGPFLSAGVVTALLAPIF
ncbi:MAG: hypothetical protein E7254_08025 [Lachnospiraceae bacterium]|jgi:prepilin signal peptidase PulO-like enzyme (type II secretory pathway)|nr:hypothetical protein [Lachnospiraceae bacterium]